MVVKKTTEGSTAAAEAVCACDPDVVACYPITPSSHVAEHLADLYAEGKLRDYIPVEQEFSSLSAIIGASAAGGRAFTATSSQGLALMHEPVFAAAGMRLPVVMVIGNRSLSAPLSIWNDWQDSISARDSGWIQLYCEQNQEVVDTVPQAFKIAEETMIPVMVCMDGFFLTHAVEPLEIPEKNEVNQFLPKLEMKEKLDASNPISMGEYALPTHYQDFRKDLFDDMMKSADVIKRVAAEYAKIVGREYGDGWLEQYKCEDAEHVLISMGSVVGNIKEAIDKLREKGEKYGVIRIKMYRPFPKEAMRKALEGKKTAGVFEKAIDMGAAGPVYEDVAESLLDAENAPKLSSFIGGMAGRDIKFEDIESMFAKIKDGNKHVEWL